MHREIILEEDNRHIRTTENDIDSCLECIIKSISWFLIIITFPLTVFFSFYVLNEFERAVVFRLGHLRKGCPFGPGIVFINPIIDQVFRVDLRTSSFDVPPQEVLTKDTVTIKVDAVVYYRLHEPLKATIQVDDVRKATKLLAQTTLRNVVGTKMLNELLASKETLSLTVANMLDEATDRWGVKVERVEIKEIFLPHELQRAMAVEQEAIREAKAKVAAADGELKAAATLKDASDVMASNPISFQLRYFQTLNMISSQNNHTIVIPFPMDIVRKFFGIAKNAPPPMPGNKTDKSNIDTSARNLESETTGLEGNTKIYFENDK